MKLLAADVKDVIGTIDPGGPNLLKGPNPAATLGTVIAFFIRMFLILASMFVLIYLLWGAFDWVTSGGDKAKVEKAQYKMTQAVIGIVVVIASLGLWLILTDNILGIITRTPDGGFIFKLPKL